MEELIKLDPTFSEARLKTNVDNIFVKLHMAVMLKDLDRVKHFLSEEVYQKYEKRIEDLKEKGLIEMFDEFNIASTDIIDVNIQEEKFQIKLKIKTKSIHYYIREDNKKYVSGNNSRREELNYFVTFTKKRDTILQGNARKCPGCGANINVNHNGKCDYCGTIYNLKDYDWILTDM